MQLCGFEVGLDRPFFLIAGTCSIEGLEMSLDVAGQLKEICADLGIPLIYKGSFDKANRSSGNTKRGVGLDAGLKILDEVRRQTGLPILTDVHDESQVEAVASVVDVLQTPAFLCRQTDFIRAVAKSGKPVNIKKGQFLAPWDMKNVIDKARAAAREAGLSEDRFLACERGVSFGYNNLVADMTSLAEMRKSGAPVVFDVTHSVQKPGGQGTSSGRARDGAGAGPRRRGRWRGGPVHGNPPLPFRSLVGWPERRSAGPDARPAGNLGPARFRDQKESFPGERFPVSGGIICCPPEPVLFLT